MFFYLIGMVLFLYFLFKYQKNFTENRVFLILLLLMLPFNNISFSLLYTFGDFLINLPKKEKSYQKEDLNRVYTKEDINIVLIFGESLRYDRFFGYNKLTLPFIDSLKNSKNFLYAKTISLATSTDVVLSLFFTTSIKQEDININNSLFKLAKQNSFTTSLISTQSEKSLKHIKEFLNIKYIDSYKIGKVGEFDDFLIKEIKDIDFNKNNFLVMQLFGQHSPYNRYPKEFKKFLPQDNSLKEKIDSDYNNSILYSDNILKSLINTIKKNSIKPTFIIFTSDHGELLGEDKKFGHNCFKKEVFTVPTFILTLNTTPNIDKSILTYHYNLSTYIRYLLGYEKNSNFEKLKHFRVNGTMLNGEDGYIYSY